MKKFLSVFFTLVSLEIFLPTITLAQSFSYFITLIGGIRNIINLLIPILVGIGTLFFFWSLITYINSADNEEQRKGARGVIIWGIVYIFVVLAIWGLINLLSTVTGISTGGASPTAPEVPVIPSTTST